MSVRRFDTLLAAYGADWDRWPEADRAAALALLAAGDPADRRAWEQARALDAVLDRAVVEPLGGAELDRFTAGVMARLPDETADATARVGRWSLFQGGPWAQSLVGGLAACATALFLIWAHPLDLADPGAAAEADVFVALAVTADGLEDAP